jgi:hypothetical protein
MPGPSPDAPVADTASSGLETLIQRTKAAFEDLG